MFTYPIIMSLYVHEEQFSKTMYKIMHFFYLRHAYEPKFCPKFGQNCFFNFNIVNFWFFCKLFKVQF